MLSLQPLVDTMHRYFGSVMEEFRQLRNRSNHEGTQSIDTIEGLRTILDDTSALSPNLIALRDGDAQALQTIMNLQDAARMSDLAALPQINLLPDSGRFVAKANPLTYNADAFTRSAFFQAYSGSVITDGGKVIYNNTNFGGPPDRVMNADAVSLLATQGRATERYPVEFNIMNLVQGDTGTSTRVKDGLTHYLATVNGSRAVFAVAKYTTLSFWINVKSGAAFIFVPYRLNGAEVAAGEYLPAGWSHVSVVIARPNGYDNGFPHIYALPGSVLQIAVPALFAGKISDFRHVSPIPTINELST